MTKKNKYPSYTQLTLLLFEMSFDRIMEFS